MNRKKVVLGLSGGVDSSTSAYMLQNDGYEVIGVTLICSEEQIGSKDLEDAKKLAKKLNIKHRILNVIDEFNKTIVKYFVDEYSEGRTPSPCVVCDEIIKMKKLIEIADEEDAFYIATGHYCEKEFNKELGVTLLKKPKDSRKDQGYMLYRVSSEVLERMIFPLAKYEKTIVREKAKEFNIEVYNKKDSQGICFAKEGYIEFLEKKLKGKIKPGNYVDKEGNILGEHRGYQLYTIGQRRGLGVLFSKVYFIIDIIPEKNEIILGDYEDLDRDIVKLESFTSQIAIEKILELELLAKPRFSSNGFLGKVIFDNGEFYFKFHEKNPQNAKGQHLVLYYKDFVIGGGKIIF